MATYGDSNFKEDWFLDKKSTPKVNAPTSISPSSNNLDPSIERNNTPFQDIQRIAGQLERTGVPSIWEQHVPCPCIDPETNSPKSDCPLCYGRGLIYRKKYELSFTYQSDDKGMYQGQSGFHEVGMTIATPQITENGIENGIAVRDRITVKDISISQSYIFNVTQDRFDKGKFIPYQVLKFDDVYSMSNSYSLVSLEEGRDFDYIPQSSKMIIKNADLIGKNITMNISTALRYYVSNITKETRSAQVKKIMDKRLLENNGSINSKYAKDYNQINGTDIKLYRMPKKLILKREDVFIPPVDFSKSTATSHKRTNPFAIDAKEYDESIASDLLGGES